MWKIEDEFILMGKGCHMGGLRYICGGSKWIELRQRLLRLKLLNNRSQDEHLALTKFNFFFRFLIVRLVTL